MLIARMFGETKIVTDCHKKSMCVTARMCEFVSRLTWPPVEQSCAPRVLAPLVGREPEYVQAGERI